VLKRINRISSRKEFETIKLKGVLCRGELVSGLVLQTEDKDKRFGIIVSKKISRRAVDRNKIRRLVYLAISENLEKLSEGIRIIFLVRPEIVGKKYEEVNIEVFNLVQKIPIKRL
jgi:ribonuclease P protein component